MAENIIMVDACVYLRIIFLEKGIDKCQDYLKSIRERNAIVLITPGILHEIIKGIEDYIDKEIANKYFKLEENKLEFKRKKMIEAHLILENLLDNVKIAFFKDIKNKQHIIAQCFEDLRINQDGKGDWDKLHLAFAISNECTEFATVDNPINLEKRNIKSISNGVMNIRYLGD